MAIKYVGGKMKESSSKQDKQLKTCDTGTAIDAKNTSSPTQSFAVNINDDKLNASQMSQDQKRRKTQKGNDDYPHLADQTVAYGSFKNTHPSHEDHDLFMKFPERIVIQESIMMDIFKEKHYYITLKAQTNLSVVISAQSRGYCSTGPTSIEFLQRKQQMSKLKSKLKSSLRKSIKTKKEVDTEFKEEIQREVRMALRDWGRREDIM